MNAITLQFSSSQFEATFFESERNDYRQLLRISTLVNLGQCLILAIAAFQSEAVTTRGYMVVIIFLSLACISQTIRYFKSCSSAYFNGLILLKGLIACIVVIISFLYDEQNFQYEYFYQPLLGFLLSFEMYFSSQGTNFLLKALICFLNISAYTFVFLYEVQYNKSSNTQFNPSSSIKKTSYGLICAWAAGIYLFLHFQYQQDKKIRKLYSDKQRSLEISNFIEKVLPTSLIVTKYNQKEERSYIYSSNKRAQSSLGITNDDSFKEFAKRVIISNNNLNQIIENPLQNEQNYGDGISQVESMNSYLPSKLQSQQSQSLFMIIENIAKKQYVKQIKNKTIPSIKQQQQQQQHQQQQQQFTSQIQLSNANKPAISSKKNESNNTQQKLKQDKNNLMFRPSFNSKQINNNQEDRFSERKYSQQVNRVKEHSNQFNSFNHPASFHQPPSFNVSQNQAPSLGLLRESEGSVVNLAIKEKRGQSMEESPHNLNFSSVSPMSHLQKKDSVKQKSQIDKQESFNSQTDKTYRRTTKKASTVKLDLSQINSPNDSKLTKNNMNEPRFSFKDNASEIKSSQPKLLLHQFKFNETRDPSNSQTKTVGSYNQHNRNVLFVSSSTPQYQQQVLQLQQQYQQQHHPQQQQQQQQLPQQQQKQQNLKVNNKGALEIDEIDKIERVSGVLTEVNGRKKMIRISIYVFNTIEQYLIILIEDETLEEQIKQQTDITKKFNKIFAKSLECTRSSLTQSLMNISKGTETFQQIFSNLIEEQKHINNKQQQTAHKNKEINENQSSLSHILYEPDHPPKENQLTFSSEKSIAIPNSGGASNKQQNLQPTQFNFGNYLDINYNINNQDYVEVNSAMDLQTQMTHSPSYGNLQGSIIMEYSPFKSNQGIQGNEKTLNKIFNSEGISSNEQNLDNPIKLLDEYLKIGRYFGFITLNGLYNHIDYLSIQLKKHLDFRVTEISLKKVINQTINVIECESQRQNIKIVVINNYEYDKMITDERRLNQILFNILYTQLQSSNQCIAIKISNNKPHSSGQIKITFFTSKQNIILFSDSNLKKSRGTARERFSHKKEIITSVNNEIIGKLGPYCSMNFDKNTSLKDQMKKISFFLYTDINILNTAKNNKHIANNNLIKNCNENSHLFYIKQQQQEEDILTEGSSINLSYTVNKLMIDNNMPHKNKLSFLPVDEIEEPSTLIKSLLDQSLLQPSFQIKKKKQEINTPVSANNLHKDSYLFQSSSAQLNQSGNVNNINVTQSNNTFGPYSPVSFYHEENPRNISNLNQNSNNITINNNYFATINNHTNMKGGTNLYINAFDKSKETPSSKKQQQVQEINVINNVQIQSNPELKSSESSLSQIPQQQQASKTNLIIQNAISSRFSEYLNNENQIKDPLYSKQQQQHKYSSSQQYQQKQQEQQQEIFFDQLQQSKANNSFQKKIEIREYHNQSIKQNINDSKKQENLNSDPDKNVNMPTARKGVDTAVPTSSKEVISLITASPLKLTQ